MCKCITIRAMHKRKNMQTRKKARVRKTPEPRKKQSVKTKGNKAKRHKPATGQDKE